MANPTFFSEGSTPNRNDTEWEILQKMLGALTDLSGGSGGPFLKLSGGTLTGDLSVPDLTVTGNGALSAPAFSVTGIPIAGGTSATTKPLVLIETAGATSSLWTADGTMFGVNAPSGFGGYIALFGRNGTAYCQIDTSGVYSRSSSLRTDGAVKTVDGLHIGANVGAIDVILLRDGAANTLALRNSTNAQTLRVYNTYTDASNGEWAQILWSANTLFLGTNKNGTGSTRNIAFQTGGTTLLTISSSNVIVSAANGLQWTGRTSLTSPSDGVLTITNNGATDFGRLQLGGTTSSFPALKRSSAILQTRLADDSDYAAFEADTIRTAKARTVAQLPAAGSAGRRAYVTDANATTYLSVVAGGGTNVVPVFDNGTNWVIA